MIARFRSGWIGAALLALMVSTAVLAGVQAWRDAPTVDEPVYAAAGLTALTRHDLRYNPQHPPLAKALAAVPVLLAQPVIPRGGTWRRGEQQHYAIDYVRAQLATRDLRLTTFLSRLVPIGELLATIALVFVLARRIGGRVGGLVAAALWALDPFVVGLGHVDGIDLPFTLATLAAAWTVWRWREHPSTLRLVVAGAVAGAAVVTRATGPLVLLATLLVVVLASRSWRASGIAALAAYATVWATYLFFDPTFTLRHLGVLPRRYLLGLLELHRVDDGTKPAFLFGQHWLGGRWWFWPASMLVKLPASLLIAIVATPVLWRLVPAGRRRTALLVLAPPAVLLVVFTVAAPQDPGLRYLLPVVALLCVATGAVGRLPRTRPVAGAAALAVSFSLATLLASFPHSIAWTQPPFQPAYRFAAGSNVDWGQDFYALQRWARGRHPWVRVEAPYGLGAREVPGARRLPTDAVPARIHGWVAASVTELQTKRADRWLLQHHPVGTLGGSILLFDLP